MSSTIRVADVSELPPGKGRVVEVAGRQYTVFNLEGRFVATSTHAIRRAPPDSDTSHTCPPHGMDFEVWMEDSPARLRDEEPARVLIEDEAVWLVVE